ncbi:unnamed protein product [Trichobilharzia regenti]|nr:unnamed protein product [Trichobilharzia regenti]
MVNSDPQYNTPKILQKSNVLDKIKSDFNVRTGDRQFLEVPAPNSVEEKLFNESWNQLTYLIRKAIITACMSIIVDYDIHLHMLADSRSSFTWDYFEYLDRKVSKFWLIVSFVSCTLLVKAVNIYVFFCVDMHVGGSA